jgi:hypothetical protein
MLKEHDQSLTWRLGASQPGTTVIEFVGQIDEDTDFTSLRSSLGGSVEFDLGGISRINSGGVRSWVNLVRALDVSHLVFARCSPAFVAQLNMIVNFRGPATIRSFFAPYVCPACDAQEDKLLDAQADFPDRRLDRAPPFPCPACGGAMELDALPERYLSFLAYEARESDET